MNKKTIAVIFGGYSSEYNVSLQSAYAVIKALDREKYDVITLGITREGQWLWYTGDIEKIRGDTWHTAEHELKSAVISPSRGSGLLVISDRQVSAVQIDAVFPVLHGKCGEDGTVQGLCELSGIPVVGCGTAASALCMDKDRAHKLVSLLGIRTPRSVCFEREPSEDELASVADKLGLPVFVKPVKAGSSLGISKVESLQELSGAVTAAFMFDDTVIIEENIPGFETGCAVMGNEALTVGRADEIELSGGFFDFLEKYSLKTSQIHMPARVDADTERRLTVTAQDIYRALGCRGFARVDMFLTPEGEIVFNEVNTIPGFTSHSRYPNMMRGVGIEFPELVDRLTGLALAGREGA